MIVKCCVGNFMWTRTATCLEGAVCLLRSRLKLPPFLMGKVWILDPEAHLRVRFFYDSDRPYL